MDLKEFARQVNSGLKEVGLGEVTAIAAESPYGYGGVVLAYDNGDYIKRKAWLITGGKSKTELLKFKELLISAAQDIFKNETA